MDLISQVIINGKDDKPCSAECVALSALLEEASGVPRAAFLSYLTELGTETNAMDVQFSVPYGDATKHWETEVFVAHGQNKPSQAIIRPARSEKTAEVFIAGVSQGPTGAVAIPASNTLRIDMGVMQPPIAILSLSAVKDTFVREATPTMSYGQSQSMACGKAADGRYTGLLEFNTTAYTAIKNQSIRGIYLEVNNLGNPATLDLNYVQDNFSEYYAMWITPLRHQYVQTVTLKKGINRIYLSEVIEGRMRLSFTGNDLAVFKTRESGTGPRLVIEYAEVGWSGYLGKVHLANQAIISAAKKKDLYSSYRLVKDLLMPGEVIVKDRNAVESRVQIFTPSLPSHGDVRQHSSIGAEAHITARKDLVSSVDNNTISGGGEADVRQWRDLVSSAGLIGETGEVNFLNGVDIIRTYITGIADVYKHLTIPSSADITTANFLGAQVTVNKSYLRGKTDVRRVKDLISKATVEAGVSSDFVSGALIRKGHIPSYVDLRRCKDLVSQAMIKGYYNFDTPASAYVIRTMIEGSGNVAQTKYSNLVSSADIVASLGSELVSCVEILHVDQKGTVAVRKDAYKDLPAHSMIRRTAYSHLNALVDVLNHSTSTGQVDVQQVSDILSHMWIRLSAVSDQFASAFLNGWYSGDHTSEVLIRKPYSDLMSHMEVRTGARQWKPMTGKLPRQWKREDFL